MQQPSKPGRRNRKGNPHPTPVARSGPSVATRDDVAVLFGPDYAFWSQLNTVAAFWGAPLVPSPWPSPPPLRLPLNPFQMLDAYLQKPPPVSGGDGRWVCIFTARAHKLANVPAWFLCECGHAWQSGHGWHQFPQRCFKSTCRTGKVRPIVMWQQTGKRPRGIRYAEGVSRKPHPCGGCMRCNLASLAGDHATKCCAKSRSCQGRG